MSSDGFNVNSNVCGEPIRMPFPTFTVQDAAFQCSNCPIEDGRAWRDDLFVNTVQPIRRDRFTDTIPTWTGGCQTNCPTCFSGPLIG